MDGWMDKSLWKAQTHGTAKASLKLTILHQFLTVWDYRQAYSAKTQFLRINVYK